MKARIRISLISASVCTSVEQLLRVSSIDLARLGYARARVSERRPRIMLASPVNLPGP